MTKKEKPKKETNKRIKLPLKYILIGIAALIVLLLSAFALYSVAYQNKNYAHQAVGKINLGGKTKDETIKILQDNSNQFLASKIVLKNTDTGKKYEIDPTQFGLSYSVDKTADDIWTFGRNNGALENLWEQLRTLFVHKEYEMNYSVNNKALIQKIKTIAGELDKPEKDYALIYQKDHFELSTERNSGLRINQELIIKDVKEQFSTLQSPELTFALNQYNPQITLESANKTLAQANNIISPGELVLKGESQEFKVDKDTIAGFIGSEADGQEMAVKFNDDRIRKYLETIAKTINVAAVNAKLKMADGKVQVFDQARTGKTLNLDESLAAIQSSLLGRINTAANSASLVIESKRPEITETEISSLGINELIGTATTSFSGSPANRVHNIVVGANGLNGILLAPGEEFSTLAHLGTIDANGGYLPELVIKDDSTVPEFGGGLCQASTTLFRMALNAGMKITERANHKYRVGYFEPLVGMDATIYDPSPDFKFVNNYSMHVLIQSKVEGTKITFEAYGTKDGRKIEVSSPAAYDITTPGAPVITETDTLPAGQRKQIEKAHNGATAKFDYKVTSASGEILQQKTFISKYIPWPEKWLVGKASSGVSASACTDGAQNGDESGIDCGGSCPNTCQ